MSPSARTISTSEFLDGLKIVRQTLDLWQAEGCPPLGRKLEPVNVGAGRGVERSWRPEDYEYLAAIPVVGQDGRVCVRGRWSVTAEGAEGRCHTGAERVGRWRDDRCLWIGRTVQATREWVRVSCVAGINRTATYQYWYLWLYLESDIDEIARCVNAGRSNPDDSWPCTEELTATDAEGRIPLDTLKSYRRRYLKDHPGERNDIDRRGCRLAKNGQAALVTEWSPQFVAWLRRERRRSRTVTLPEERRPKLPGGAVTDAEALDEYGFPQTSLFRWRSRKGCPWLRRRLKAVKVKGVWYNSGADLEAIKKAKANPLGPYDPHETDDGREFYSASYLEHKHNILAQAWAPLRNKLHRLLGGKVFEAIRITRIHPKIPSGKLWVYDGAAAQRIADARRTGEGQATRPIPDSDGDWFPVAKTAELYDIPVKTLYSALDWARLRASDESLVLVRTRTANFLARKFPRRSLAGGRHTDLWYLREFNGREEDLPTLRRKYAGQPPALIAVPPLVDGAVPTPPASNPTATGSDIETLRRLWNPDSPEYQGHTEKTQTTGRLRDPDTASILKFCYDEYILNRNPASDVLADLEEEWGARCRGMQEFDVRKLAKRWSHRFDPPLPMNR
jgi:hypothetical protein